MVEKAIIDLKDGLLPLPTGYEWVALTEGIYHDELVKRMSVFATGKYPEPIHINGSKISQPLGSIDFFVEFDMSKVIGSYDPDKILNSNKADLKAEVKDENPLSDRDASNKVEDKDKTPIDLRVKCTKRDIKLLRSIKQADAVAVLFDSNQKTYLFTDGNTTIEIEQSEYVDLPSPHNLSGEAIGEPVSVDPDQMKLFKSKGNTVVLELIEEQLESIAFQGGIRYSFSVENTLNLMNKQPDRRLYSRHFLEITGKDSVKLTIAKDTDGEYWLISETRLTLKLTATTFERLS